MRRFWVMATLALGSSLGGCKTDEGATVAPKTAPEPVAAAEPSDAGTAEAVAMVELSAVPPLPPTPLGLSPLTDSKDNPTTPEKAALGHLLFFDKRMSKDLTMACESCHHIDKAYTEGQPVSAKVGGAMNVRNAPTMLNLGYHTTYYWDGRMPTLEAVSNAAWKGQLGADPSAIAGRLNEVPVYKAHFQRAFGEPATADNVPKALAAFFRSLNVGNSPWDRHEAGDAKAVSKDAEKGFELFKAKGCTLCHVPPLYSDFDYHNVGVGMDKPEDKRDKGRTDATKDAADLGKFKTPMLRNVAMTGPYFHDGSVATLEGAIDLMLAGGKKSPNLDPKLKPQKATKKERAQLKAFLESLSGEMTYTTAPELPQ